MQQHSTDEIDLLKVFYNIIKVIRDHFRLILILILVGALLGLAHSLTSKKVYESKMIVSSSILTLSYVNELVGNLNLLLDGQNYALASQKLNLTEAQTRQITRISVESVLNNADQLQENEKTYMKITVQAISKDVFQHIQVGLIHYIDDNEYVKLRIEQQKNYYKQLISKVNSEIADLEVFKVRMLKGDFFQEMKGNVMFDPTIVNSKILDLTKERINYENALVLADNTQLIDGFTAFSQPRWPRKSTATLAGAGVGLLLAFLIILFRVISREFKKEEAKRAQVS